LQACFAAPVVGVEEAAPGAGAEEAAPGVVVVAPPLVSLGALAGGVDPPHPMRIPPTAAASIVFVIIVLDLRFAPDNTADRSRPFR
jgi:hypothetical protein